MLTILCPECQRPIEFDSEPKIGQQTTCQSCTKELVVTWLYPVSLDSPEISEQFQTDVEK
jgi:hypothetical protein